MRFNPSYEDPLRFCLFLVICNSVPLTTTAFVSKPSVTDNGSVAVFFAGDKTIHAIVSSPMKTQMNLFCKMNCGLFYI